MITYENIGLAFFEIFPSIKFVMNESKLTENPRPGENEFVTKPT